MKRIMKTLSLLLAAVMLMSIMPLSGLGENFATTASAQEFTQDIYTYTVENNCATIKKANGFIHGGITIPTTLGGLPVTGIGEGAFSDCGFIENVTILENITEITTGAFYKCNKLTGITVADDNPDFSSEDGVLFNKNKTQLIQYPIGNERNSYDIPKSVTEICNSAFAYCEYLKKVTIPEGVKKIDYQAFAYCSYLTDINIPKSVTEIASGAFLENGYYKDENNWENKALYNGNFLLRAEYTSISGNYKIREGTRVIADDVLSYCDFLTGITLPDSVVYIGKDAFSYCENLKEITIPHSVTDIGDSTFSCCYRLENITVGSGLKNMGKDVFRFCLELSNIEIDKDNPYFSSAEGVLFNKDKTKLLLYPQGHKRTSYSIPKGVKSVGEMAFYHCNNLKEITIPDSVTDIESWAFSQNKALKEIVIPNSVKNIGDSLFDECYGLENATISANIKSIGYETFRCCTSLKSITFPNTVTEIGKGAFRNCNSLKNIVIPNSVIKIGENAFSETGYYNDTANWEKEVLYIGNHLIKAKNNIAGDYRVKEGTKVIADRAFYSCNKLTGITIPKSVISIGDGAFEECDILKNIHYEGKEVKWNKFADDEEKEAEKTATVYFNEYSKATLPTNRVKTAKYRNKVKVKITAMGIPAEGFLVVDGEKIAPNKKGIATFETTFKAKSPETFKAHIESENGTVQVPEQEYKVNVDNGFKAKFKGFFKDFIGNRFKWREVVIEFR